MITCKLYAMYEILDQGNPSKFIIICDCTNCCKNNMQLRIKYNTSIFLFFEIKSYFLMHYPTNTLLCLTEYSTKDKISLEQKLSILKYFDENGNVKTTEIPY